jgi:hypothetical protein
MTVVARDYHFAAPDTVPPGLTTVRLVNRGGEAHHLLLVRLSRGRTLAQLEQALAGVRRLPSWATPIGGPNARELGSEALATLTLRAGRYAILCLTPSPDGTTHLMKGMSRELTVAPGARVAAEGVEEWRTAVPPVDVELTLGRGGYRFSKPLAAGTHRVRVRNAGTEPHEVAFYRLLPGRTPGDVAAWAARPAGPPPAALVGGVTPLAPGLANEIPLELQRGEYALVCRIAVSRHAPTGAEHAMVARLSVA